MPRLHNVSVQNNFSKGVITEATGLTFPENACTDADNCNFNHFGFCSRRLGFDLENQFGTFTKDISGKVMVTYLWKNVNGEGDRNYVVVQIGDNLYFYKVTSDSALSANKHSSTIDLTTFSASSISVATLECQFSSGNGLLFVTNRQCTSFYVQYNPDTGSGDSFTATAINIQIRDFDGDTFDSLFNGSGMSTRPTATIGTLNADHRYNLENQGWNATTLTSWDTARTDMPANADVPWTYKNATNQFDFSTVGNFAVGNSAAPNGHFIYGIYNISRSSNVSGLTAAASVTIATERVSTNSFYAGRIFFAGLKAPNCDSKVYFSQVVENNTQYGMCYQVNDPTSETLFDLLPTDGGVIDIIGAGNIIKMVPVQQFLLVFATNGIWAITGSQGQGFAANDYSVNKISSITNVSPTSFVDSEGVPYWWNLEGIYTVQMDPQTNALRVVSITDQTIRTLFLAIPSESKQYARGIFDQFTKRIQWIYKSQVSTSFNDRYIYDSVLTLNLLSGGFSPWSVSTNVGRIHGIVDVFGFSGVFSQQNVVWTHGATDNVIESNMNGGAQVIAFISANTSITSVVKYLCSYVSGGNTLVTFSENYKDSYLDWESISGGSIEYDSFFETGYSVHGHGVQKFQQNYVYVYSENSVDSSFKLQGMWDYGGSGNSGRWSTAQIFTILEDAFGFKINKVKIRGQGLACQLKFTSNGTYPFNIVGWAIFETGNQWV